MERLSTLAVAGLFAVFAAQAQTSDIVVFSEMGEKFTLVIDGDVKNEAPATRVVATGLKNATPSIIVRFADAGIAPINQNGWMEPGKEYTLKITTNKKGARVLRMQGQAELGTAAAAEGTKPKPSGFVEDGGTQQTSGGTQSTTTTTVVENGDGSGASGENVNMSIGVNGVGMNMNVGVNDGTGGTSTTSHSSTTTTTTTSTHVMNNQNVEVDDKQNTTSAYHMPGYNGPIGCGYPMSDGEFDDARKSIEGKGFEESKMTTAKQVGGGHCFKVSQVKTIMGLFGFEETKLDFAKFAYDHVYDKGNYYQVNDVFGFESSIDDLNKYIQSR